MIPSDQKKTDKHPADLLPMYVDEGLSTDERRLVENHIRECAPCSEELESLKLVINVLKKEKTVFCPEPWELYEFIEQGTDPSGKMAQHLEDCPLCCAEVTEYKEISSTNKLPDKIKNEIRRSFPNQGHSEKFRWKSWFAWASEWLRSLFPVRALALGTAVATIFLAIFLYPHETLPPYIAASSENWAKIGTPGTPKSIFSEAHSRKGVRQSAPLAGSGTPNRLFLEAAKPRVATIILFQGLKKPEPQSTIDSLYQALEPWPEMKTKFQFLTPVQLRDFLEKASDRKVSPTQALNQFYKEFSVNLALIANVKPNKEKFGLTTEVIDTRTGQILAESTRDDITRGDLASALGQTLELLNMVKTNGLVR
jgi:Putative zinc-finger